MFFGTCRFFCDLFFFSLPLCVNGPLDLVCCVQSRIIIARKRGLGQGNMFTGVCLSTRGGAWSGGLVPGGCLVPGVPGPGGGYLLPRGALSWGGICSRGVPGGAPRTATAAGGTHPTGMHSCFVMNRLSS